MLEKRLDRIARRRAERHVLERARRWLIHRDDKGWEPVQAATADLEQSVRALAALDPDGVAVDDTRCSKCGCDFDLQSEAHGFLADRLGATAGDETKRREDLRLAATLVAGMMHNVCLSCVVKIVRATLLAERDALRDEAAKLGIELDPLPPREGA